MSECAHQLFNYLSLYVAGVVLVAFAFVGMFTVIGWITERWGWEGGPVYLPGGDESDA